MIMILPPKQRTDDPGTVPSEELACAHARIRDLEAALEAAERRSGTLDAEVRIDAALIRSEQRFRRLIENLHLGVVVQGPKSEILLFNRRALELLGLSEDELLGRSSFHPSWDVIREDGSPYSPEQRPVAMVLATGNPVLGVVMGIKRPRHQDLVWLLVNAMPEYDERGEVLQIVATLDDITERKGLEDSLRQAQKLESLGLLAGGIAHDFNNLLTVITSCTELALAQLPPESQAVPELDDVLGASERASSLTRQLLAFARRQTGSPCRVDIGASIESFKNLLARLLGDRHRLLIEAEPGPIAVQIDQSQLEQVLVNLVVNARDAMPNGGCVTIVIGRLGPGQAPPPLAERAAALLCVRDQGVGIPSDLLERVFEPFFTTKEVGRGTGLGLATVNGIVRAAGGHIHVASEPGCGTEFSVFLPLLPEAAQSSISRRVTGMGHGERVLVVDDDDVLRAVTARMLGELGYETACAADGFDALDLLEQQSGNFDVLFTDIVMPRMGGLELAHRVRERWPEIRVIASSTHEVDVREIDAMLPKPFNMAALGHIIRATLNGDEPNEHS